MKAALIILGTTLLAQAGHAQELRRTVSTPEVGEVATASVGSIVFERQDYNVVPVARLAARYQRTTGLMAKTDVDAGVPLPIRRDDKKLMACSTDRDDYLDCFVDSDGDARFDRLTEIGGLFPLKIDPPIAYERSEEPIADGNSFKRVVTFLGRSGDSLRFSYREFANDMARPAFTEEVTFSVPNAYPDTVVFRDLQLELIGLSNAGLRYRVTSAATLSLR